MTRALALCLLALFAGAVSGAAPPSPPPYNTPPGAAPVTLSSDTLPADSLGQGIVNFNFASLTSTGQARQLSGHRHRVWPWFGSSPRGRRPP
jgi:hypothetical protein